MTVTIGILVDADVWAARGGSWAWSGGGPEIVVSPPASLDDVRRRAAIVSTSPTMSLAGLRALTGPGPALFRAVVPLGTGPGEGAVALAAEPGTPKETIVLVKEALAWIGAVEVVAEDALDAVAALVLGGAAFLAETLQGMEEGAVRDGLPRDIARAFGSQTVLATALLLRDHPGSPADLKDQVASPGGTTIAALATLEDAGVRGAYIRAVQQTAVQVRRRRDAVEGRAK